MNGQTNNSGNLSEAVRAYMAEIGRRGGKAGKGKHGLSSEQARANVAVRWAKAKAGQGEDGR